MGDRLFTKDMGRKLGGGLCPLWEEGGSPCNTKWATFIPSGILIHPSVWPQYTNVTDRTGQRETERADNGKGFPYSTPSVGPRADPGVQAVSLQVTVSHPPGGRLPLLSARPVVTSQPQSITALWPVPSYTAW